MIPRLIDEMLLWIHTQDGWKEGKLRIEEDRLDRTDWRQEQDWTEQDQAEQSQTTEQG